MTMFKVERHGWKVGDIAYPIIGGDPMMVIGIMKDQNLVAYGCACAYRKEDGAFEAFTFPFACITDGSELEDSKRSAL